MEVLWALGGTNLDFGGALDSFSQSLRFSSCRCGAERRTFAKQTLEALLQVILISVMLRIVHTDIS